MNSYRARQILMLLRKIKQEAFEFKGEKHLCIGCRTPKLTAQIGKRKAFGHICADCLHEVTGFSTEHEIIRSVLS